MLCSIIIVNYNTSDLLLKCLRSIEENDTSLNKEIIVVDNNSSDDSIKLLNKKYPKVKVIVNSSNLGYAKANNIGAKVAKGDYLLLLNSDTIINKGAISKLVSRASQDNSAISSCMLLNSDNSIQPQGGSLPSLCNLFAWMLFIDDLPILSRLINRYQQRDANFFNKDQQPGWLSGTALLIKRDLFEKLDGLDENIFMYAEDVEFCVRANLANHQANYYYQPSIVHLGQGSGASSNAIIGEFKGLIYIFNKHKPAWQLPILRLLLSTGAFLRWLIFGIIALDKQKRKAYAKALKVARQ